MTGVDPGALIEPTAEIGADVELAQGVIVGPGARISDGCRLEPGVVIHRGVALGEGCRVGAYSVIGGEPQDLKYRGEETHVEIGARTRIGEYVTINRGTAASGITRVGEECFLMAYVHVAHDCVLEDHVILANGVQLGGHVLIESCAQVGGLTPIHQFVRIGKHAFVGGGSRVPRDVPPFGHAAGSPLRMLGPNTEGLKRAGLTPDRRLEIKRAFRLLFNSSLRLQEAIAQLESEGTGSEVAYLLDFLKRSRRGVGR